MQHQPGAPRITDFDSLPASASSNPGPASPAGLKLHVSTVLRAASAAGQPVGADGVLPAGSGFATFHADRNDSLELMQSADSDTPVESPRGAAAFAFAATAAAAGVGLTGDDSCDSCEGTGN